MKLPHRISRNLVKSTTLFSLLMFGIQLAQVSAQDCDGSLVPAEKSGYQRRSNRCEGFYRIKVAAEPTIELRGFTLGVLQYDITNTGDEIRLSRPFAIPSTPHVRAGTLSARYHYRMDADLPEGDIFRWPVDDVLKPYSLDASKIRVFGWYTNKGQTVFFPVKVTSASAAARDDDIPTMTFQISAWVNRLVCRWMSTAGKQNSVCTDGTTRYGPGDPIEVDLPHNLSGRVDMEVKALIQDERGTRWLKRDLTVNMGGK